MSLLQRNKTRYRRLRQAAPGTRFVKLHESMQGASTSRWRVGLGILVGTLLVLAGLALGLIPGVPGFLVVLLGLGVIAAQVREFARWCDRSELAIRRWFGSIRDR